MSPSRGADARGGGSTGESYTFERRVGKVAGGRGFADVWKKDHFGWEYKGPGKDLGAAYRQLLTYREDLDNPPLLIVSDIQNTLIHTNFTGTTKKVYEVGLEELADPAKLALLRQAFTDPATLNPKRQRERITEDATDRIGSIARRLQDRGHPPEQVAHFLMQLVFALFAEDVKLLPNHIVTRILERTGTNPGYAERYLTELLRAMAEGGLAVMEEIPQFNGGLFQGEEALRLEEEELRYHHQAVAKMARYLVEVRDQIIDADPKLTMTKLYNELDELREERNSSRRTYPLLVAHERLDEAVAAAYGWEWPLEEDEILSRLLVLNLERAAAEERAAAD